MSVLLPTLCRRGLASLRMLHSSPSPVISVGACQHCRYSSLRCSRQHFWSFFGSRGGTGRPSTQSSNAVQHQRIVEKAHRDATLHNERLLDACLDLLAICGNGGNGGGSSLGNSDADSINAIAAVVETTLHDLRKTPSEQFDLVYAALCTPVAENNRQVQRCLMVVLEAFLPEVLFRVFESENLFVGGDRQRSAVIRLVHALLGHVEAPDGIESEEVVLVYMDDVRGEFPSLQRSPAFLVLEANATNIAMRAKLFALLSQLCAEFDAEGTGKVDLAELRRTAERVLGEDKARMLLDGAQPDEEGKIRYTQLTSLLTRPPPRQK